MLQAADIRLRPPFEEGVFLRDLLGQIVESPSMHLQGESVCGLPEGVMSVQDSELAQEDNVIGVIPLQIFVEFPLRTTPQVIFENFLCSPCHSSFSSV